MQKEVFDACDSLFSVRFFLAPTKKCVCIGRMSGAKACHDAFLCILSTVGGMAMRF